MGFLELPHSADAWHTFISTYATERLDTARSALAELRDFDGSAAQWVERWNAGDCALDEAATLTELLAETHPEASIRALAEELGTEAKTLRVERLQDPLIAASLAALDRNGLEPEAAEVLRRLESDYRSEGALLDDAAREELAGINRRITELSNQFSEHIRGSVAAVELRPEQLEGLPQDFIDAHPVGDSGLVTITTDYPDLLPMLDMARDADARHALMLADRTRAYPQNLDVLRELLDLRHRKAQMLGYQDYPTYATASMMMPSGDGIGEFIDDIARTARPAGQRDVAQLLELVRRDKPEAKGLSPADSRYYIERLKAEAHGVDQQEVRSYLRYERVRDGILALMTELFGASFVRVDVPTWHPDVESYDVVEGSTVLGRIHLDMHPREGKFGHAACFELVPGIAGRALPESVLVCNFSRGLMSHDELETYLHEFGHLIHAIFSGHHPYAYTASFGDRWEWDFIEAPSQLLEEWAWDVAVLQRFAVNDAGEAIPASLVEAMNAARYTSEGLLTCRQLSYGALSYRLHRDHPHDIDALAAAVEAEYDVREPFPGSHDWASFGHLTDYSSNYYTYQWSLSICHDLLTGFNRANLLDPTPARRYRECILEPGATKASAQLVEDFLGRPLSSKAYQDWLATL